MFFGSERHGRILRRRDDQMLFSRKPYFVDKNRIVDGERYMRLLVYSKVVYTLSVAFLSYISTQIQSPLNHTHSPLTPISTLLVELLSTPTSQEPTPRHKPNMLAHRTLLQASRATLSTTPTRLIHSTPKLLQAAAREEQAAHTASQRVRYWIKSLPVETYPLCK